MDIESLRVQLKEVSVPKLSALCGVCTKTIYRVRGGDHMPTLRTFLAIRDGIGKLAAKGSRK